MANPYTTQFRQYDPRLGRWFSPDPIHHPWQSPYSAMDCNPVGYTDPYGLSTDKEKKTYTVKSGDNLTRIAKEHGTTVEKILEENKDIKNPDLIYPGDKLVIIAESEEAESDGISVSQEASPYDYKWSEGASEPSLEEVTGVPNEAEEPVGTHPVGEIRPLLYEEFKVIQRSHGLNDSEGGHAFEDIALTALQVTKYPPNEQAAKDFGNPIMTPKGGFLSDALEYGFNIRGADPRTTQPSYFMFESKISFEIRKSSKNHQIEKQLDWLADKTYFYSFGRQFNLYVGFYRDVECSF